MSSIPTSESTARASRRASLRTRRARTGLAGAAMLVAAPLLGACAAGSSPEVFQIQPDNGNGKAGYMWISNVWVVTDPMTGNAEVIGQVANTDPNQGDSNTLTSISLAGAGATITQPTGTSTLQPGVQVSGGNVIIPGLQSVQFGQTGQPGVQVASASLTVGSTTQVVYSFSGGENITINAIVEPDAGQWSQYDPNGASASAGASSTASGTAAATGTASPAVSGTVTATATATGTSTATAGSTGSPTPTATH